MVAASLFVFVVFCWVIHRLFRVYQHLSSEQTKAEARPKLQHYRPLSPLKTSGGSPGGSLDQLTLMRISSSALPLDGFGRKRDSPSPASPSESIHLGMSAEPFRET
ncbi:hypothetical protein PROFUN_08758 [Planoprotostelium fungivorum]|nr:hypothetical protein PROFUN_08758 [Planoprotostelium fungivorum]